MKATILSISSHRKKCSKEWLIKLWHVADNARHVTKVNMKTEEGDEIGPTCKVLNRPSILAKSCHERKCH